MWGGCVAEAYALLSERAMPLTRSAPLADAVRLLQAHTPREFFPEASSPDTLMVGMWLGAGAWDKAHAIAQDLETTEGSYWHAIIHRQEPDASNAKYWFRRMGSHVIYEPLGAAAQEIDARHGGVLRLPERWDPARFVDICVSASGTPREQAAREVQQAEWKLLMGWCMRGSLA